MPAPTFTVLRTGFAAVLLAARAQVALVTRLPADRVLLVTRPDVPHFGADQDVLLWPRGFVAEKTNDGCGRVDARVKRRLSVVCRTRCGELDEADRNTALLTNATLGLFALEEAVADALQDFWPEDGQGNALLAEPMRLLTDTEPGAEKAQKGWGQSQQDYEVLYTLNLDQARQ